MYTEYMYKDSLAHHGILGQKWGKRNGPPYPLDYEAHSRTEKSRNSKARIDGKASTTGSIKKSKSSNVTKINSSKKSSKSEKDTKKKGLTDKQKKIIKGVAVGAGVAAAVGLSAYSYAKNPAVHDAVDAFIAKVKNKNISELNSEANNPMAKYGISYQKSYLNHNGVRTELDIANDLKVSNMGSKANPVYRNHNCFKNAVNLEMRARGLDTISQDNGGMNSDNALNISKTLFPSFGIDSNEAKNIQRMMVKEMSTDDFIKNMKSQPKGSRGIIAARLKGGDIHDYHFFNYRVKENGAVEFLDGYADRKYSITNFGNDPDGKFNYFQTNGIMFFRTDNRDLNYDIIADNFVQKNQGYYYDSRKMKKASKILKEVKQKGFESKEIQDKYGDLLATDQISKKLTKYGVGNLYGLKKAKIR